MMAILIDPPVWPAHDTLWSHLVSDTDYEELHVFAARMRLPRRSFDLDHYDVPASLYQQAVALGALPVGAKDIVHQLRSSGLRVRQIEREAVRPLRRRQYLDAEWALLGDSLGVSNTPSKSEDWHFLGAQLLIRWNEPHRSYHDERHLEDVLLALDQLATRGERVSSETLLAAWFHDAVYKSNASDELDSAELAVTALGKLNLDPSVVHFVGELIVDTTPGRLIENPAEPLAHLLDSDLAIFGSSATRYGQYSIAVRTEYAHIASTDFVKGRAAILQGYLDQPRIYRTTTAQDLWEARARDNLSREINELRLSEASLTSE